MDYDWKKRLTESIKSKVENATHAFPATGVRRGGCCVDKNNPSIVPDKTLLPGAWWEGVFFGWSGYAKANREIALRVANHLPLRISQSLEPTYTDDYQKNRISHYHTVRVHPSSPYVLFFGPDRNLPDTTGPKILYTMMETELTHPNMVECINGKFDEVWTPTRWNAEVFKKSGVKPPIRVVPLGVDPVVYRPFEKKPHLPLCEVLTGPNAGKKEIPKGFLFLSVALPSFRKGFDILSKAMSIAFENDPDVGLVVAATHAGPNNATLQGLRGSKTKLWALTGSYDEHQMASIFNGCDAYVSASRGEGWNLGICEAAACNIPVICPDNTAHPEVVGDAAFVFHGEGSAPIPSADSISKWYKDMPFATFGEKSIEELVSLLRLVRAGGEGVEQQKTMLRHRVLSLWSWGNSAEIAARRLLELQP